MPGGRMVCMVATKFSPVKIELKPRIKAPTRASETRVPVVVL